MVSRSRSRDWRKALVSDPTLYEISMILAVPSS
jgi:hypothetical protein